MQIIHKVTFEGTKAAEFRELGVNMVRISPESPLINMLQFTMAEDDSRWKKTHSIIKKLGALDFAETRFTPYEFDRAQFLAVLPSWHHGYPQPEEDFQYKKTTYDLSHYCSACQIGARQVAPFQMKRPPIWGEKSVLQLNWVFDEYFVKPETWKRVFERFGIKCRPVLQHPSGQEMETVVQLDISERAELLMESYPRVQCQRCGTRSYLHVNGFFPSPAATGQHLFKSLQWFGDGSVPVQAVVVSQPLYRAIQDAKIRGLEFQACLPPQIA
jgi:hypothetical protein